MCSENKYKDLIVITNRALVDGDFFDQLRKVMSLSPNSCILREKDLNDVEYYKLAQEVLEICDTNHVPLYIHGKIDIAKSLKCRNIHMSFTDLQKADRQQLAENFDNVSVSCHSLEEVELAPELGATRIILGTIFETECKKGLKGKGTEFVREACKKSQLPVYAIGGINLDNLKQVLEAGAAGGCMMSGFMRA